MAADPLILLHRPFLRALDPATGKLLWEFEFPNPTGVGRLFLDEDCVMATMGPQLYFFESETGTVMEEVALGFTPDFGALDEHHRLYLGNHLGAFVCFTSGGRLQWRIDSDSEWSSETICLDGAKKVMWKRKAPSREVGTAVGMAIGRVLVQPDRIDAD